MRVADGITLAGFLNAGQDCTRGVPGHRRRKRARRRRRGAARPVRRRFPIGDPFDEGTELGPLVSQRQRDRVAGFVERATAAGATIATGGQPSAGRGWFYEPSVLYGVAQSDEIVQREVFGPVVTVQRMDRRGRGVRHGQRRRLRPGGQCVDQETSAGPCALAAELRFGTVWINDHIPSVSEMPHGGFKQSGYGKDMSMYAIESYTEAKHVMVKW